MNLSDRETELIKNALALYLNSYEAHTKIINDEERNVNLETLKELQKKIKDSVCIQVWI